MLRKKLNKKGALDFSIEGIFKLILFTLALFLIIVILPSFLIFWKGMMAIQKIDGIAADLSAFSQSGSSDFSSPSKEYLIPNTVSNVYIGMGEDGTESVCAEFFQDKIAWDDYCAPINSQDPVIMIGKVEEQGISCDPTMVGISIALLFVPGPGWLAKAGMTGGKLLLRSFGLMKYAKLFVGGVAKYGGRAAWGAAKGVYAASAKAAMTTLKTMSKKIGVGSSLFKSERTLGKIATDSKFEKIYIAAGGNIKKGTTILSLPGGKSYNLATESGFMNAMKDLGVGMKAEVSTAQKGISTNTFRWFSTEGKEFARLETKSFMTSGVMTHEAQLLTGNYLKAVKYLSPLKMVPAKSVLKVGVGTELYKYMAYDCGTRVNLSFHSCNAERASKQLENEYLKFQQDSFSIWNVGAMIIGCDPPVKPNINDPCAAGYEMYIANQDAFLQQKQMKEIEKIKSDDCKNYIYMLLNPTLYNINCYCSDDFVAHVIIKKGGENKYSCKGILGEDGEMACIDVETNEGFSGNCSGFDLLSISECMKCNDDDKDLDNDCNKTCILSQTQPSCILTKAPETDVEFKDKSKLIRIDEESDGSGFFCDYSTDPKIITQLRDLYSGTTGTSQPYVEVNCSTGVKNISFSTDLQKALNHEGPIDKKVFALYSVDANGKAQYTDLTTTIMPRWNCEGKGNDEKCYTCILAGEAKNTHFENSTAIKQYILGSYISGRTDLKFICTKEKVTVDGAKSAYKYFPGDQSASPPTQPTLSCILNTIDFCQKITFSRWDTSNLGVGYKVNKVSYSVSTVSLITDITYEGTAVITAPFVNDPDTAFECSNGNYCSETCSEGSDCDGFCGGEDVLVNPCSVSEECKQNLGEMLAKIYRESSQRYIAVQVDEVEQQTAAVGMPCHVD